jgi:hypothetical protein
MGWDLILISKRGEVWGSTTRTKPLAKYFVHVFEDMGLCDVLPLKFVPTWMNLRTKE